MSGKEEELYVFKNHLCPWTTLLLRTEVGASRSTKLMTNLSQVHEEQGQKSLTWEGDRIMQDGQLAALLTPAASQTVVTLQEYEAKLSKKYHGEDKRSDAAADKGRDGVRAEEPFDEEESEGEEQEVDDEGEEEEEAAAGEEPRGSKEPSGAVSSKPAWPLLRRAKSSASLGSAERMSGKVATPQDKNKKKPSSCSSKGFDRSTSRH